MNESTQPGVTVNSDGAISVQLSEADMAKAQHFAEELIRRVPSEWHPMTTDEREAAAKRINPRVAYGWMGYASIMDPYNEGLDPADVTVDEDATGTLDGTAPRNAS